MKVVRSMGDDRIAKVYVADTPKGGIEFAESIQPPLTREQKWVLIVSCLIGCPARCKMCDAGKKFAGKLTKEEIFEQLDYMVDRRFPDRRIPSEKFKIQFTRMGEPAFNSAVLDVLEELPERYDAPGLIPCVSTIGPEGYEKFFERLTDIKNHLYCDGRFQMQFSMHTSDKAKRDELIPIPKMTFEEIAQFGQKFMKTGDRKITLNFVVMNGYPIDAKVLRSHFDPLTFLIKLTPLNPTNNAKKNALKGVLDPEDESSVSNLVHSLQKEGYDVIVSIGDNEENEIGSNCGMYVSATA